MIKSDVTAALRKAAGGAEFISQKEIRQCLGYSDKAKVREIVQGINGIGNRYYIPDVAERIMQEVR